MGFDFTYKDIGQHGEKGDKQLQKEPLAGPLAPRFKIPGRQAVRLHHPRRRKSVTLKRPKN